jgi:endonuclease YncB( thermonuclease family)
MENGDVSGHHWTTLHTERKGLLFDRASLIALALFFSWLSITQAADYSGLVVSVLDGDTIDILHKQHPERIRLSGIDCPEKGQSYGHQAKQATAAMVLGKEVLLQTHGRDRSGRILAEVRLPDGTHVNHTLVKNGWCWWYWKFAPRNTELARLEKHARETEQGLWASPTHVPPWEWRKRTR